jgi:MoaA/NifB/PqqE/SkfB family radical SAM enzyme
MIGRTHKGARKELRDMKTVDRSVGVFFWNAVKISLGRPGHAWQFIRILLWQTAAARIRRAWKRRGVRVPPIIIFSITHQCNLQCAGCYAQVLQGVEGAPGPALGPSAEGAAKGEADAGGKQCSAAPPTELSDDKLGSIVAEAADLGVSFFVIAGGEPLMRSEIFAIAERFPKIIFLLFTNGVLLTDEMVGRVVRLRNIVPLLSLEGSAAQTDERRGEGTYEQLMVAMARLDRRRHFFGCSLTLTSRNFSTIFSDGYIAGLAKAGCRFFLFADYTPVDPDTEDWVLTAWQREQVEAHMRAMRKQHQALFIAVPWDEREVGGCLSAGKGFIHINASGEVEPCPFAPFSDCDLSEVSLLEALQSPFLARLRELPQLFEYEGGGCELWKNREQVERALAEVRAGSQ